MNLHKLHPFDANWVTATDYRAKRPLFNDMDHIRGKGSLTNYAIGEVNEAIEELEVSGKPNSEKIADELNDVFNMMVAVTVMTVGRDFQPSKHLYNVNGDGKHSDAFERLTQTIAESEHDNKAIIETFRLLWSIGMHSFDRDTNKMTDLIIRTYQKVSSNYPIDLYDGTDPMTGEVLRRDEDKEAVFSHVTTGLKKVRKSVQRTLRPNDVEPVKDLIADWTNSESALAELERRLPGNDTTRDSGIIIPSPETTILITEKNGILFDNSTTEGESQ